MEPIDIEAQIEELREATREMHAAMKDSRAERKALEAERDKLGEAITFALREVDTIINDKVEKSLEEYMDSVATAIDNATKSVYKRFDSIAEILLGEDKKSKQEGLPSLEEGATRIVKRPRGVVIEGLLEDAPGRSGPLRTD